MKKSFEDFKKLDMPMRFALVGTAIGMVGYFFGEGGNSDFWDAIMWIGTGIGFYRMTGSRLEDRALKHH